MPKKRTIMKHVTRTVIKGGQQVKFREAHAFNNDPPIEQNFVLNDNLFHTEGIKHFRAKGNKRGFEIKTDCGDIDIKCPCPAAYFVSKDAFGTVTCRLMTEEEIEASVTKLPTQMGVMRKSQQPPL